MDMMSVDHPDELLESLDERNWTLGDRIAFIERVIELELTGSRRSSFEFMLALHQLENIRMALYRNIGPSQSSVSGGSSADEQIRETRKNLEGNIPFTNKKY